MIPVPSANLGVISACMYHGSAENPQLYTSNPAGKTGSSRQGPAESAPGHFPAALGHQCLPFTRH